MQDELHPWSQRHTRLLIGVFLLAAGLRCATVLVRTPREPGIAGLAYPDERDYWRMGESLAAGRTLRDEMGMVASRMPGYPAFLAIWMGAASPAQSARVAQGVIGALGCVIVVAIGTRLAGPRIGLIAGLFAALDPFAVLFSGLLLSETLFATALGAWMLSAVRIAEASRASRVPGEGGGPIRWWVLWGVGAVVSVYLHPSVALLIPILGGLLGWRRRTWRSFAGLCTALMVILLGLAPWAIRNQRVLGGTCVLTTRLGISLYDGVGPQATGRSDLAYTKELPEIRDLDELAWNRWFFREGVRCMRSEPGRTVSLALRKFLLTWNIFPNAPDQRSAGRMAISAAWMVPMLVLGGIGLVRGRIVAGGRTILLIPVAYFTLLHMLFVGSVRYRVPIMPFVEILAAVGLTVLARRLVWGSGRDSRL